MWSVVPFRTRVMTIVMWFETHPKLKSSLFNQLYSTLMTYVILAALQDYTSCRSLAWSPRLSCGYALNQKTVSYNDRQHTNGMSYNSYLFFIRMLVAFKYLFRWQWRWGRRRIVFQIKGAPLHTLYRFEFQGQPYLAGDVNGGIHSDNQT